MNKCRIYIDETGNPDLKSSNNDNHRFLSLTGVIIRLDYVDNFLHDDMENFKKDFLITILMTLLFFIERKC